MKYKVGDKVLYIDNINKDYILPLEIIKLDRNINEVTFRFYKEFKHPLGNYYPKGYTFNDSISRLENLNGNFKLEVERKCNKPKWF